MHHYRVNVNGPERAVKAIVAELTSVGARLTEGANARCLVMTSPDGIQTWEALSRRHPQGSLGLECFETFEDELLQLVIENGRVTVMARGSVLPEGWGSFHDEDGELLDGGLLRAAAESVAAQRLQHDVGTLSGGLDIALAMGKALGRFCRRVEATVWAGPPREALDAVIELAVFALWISTCGRSMGVAESQFEQAFRLTQSMVDAGCSEFRDKPGDADWNEWLQVLTGSASDVIDAACHWSYERDTEAHALGGEHSGTPIEQLEGAARSMLTTCLQVLALFDTAADTPLHA